MTLLMTVAASWRPSPERATGPCSVQQCIHRAAIRWNVSEAMLRRKAWCESADEPRGL